MTSSECHVCGRECAVGIQVSVRLGKRIVQWRECVACFLKAEREHG